MHTYIHTRVRVGKSWRWHERRLDVSWQPRGRWKYLCKLSTQSLNLYVFMTQCKNHAIEWCETVRAHRDWTMQYYTEVDAFLTRGILGLEGTLSLSLSLSLPLSFGLLGGLVDGLSVLAVMMVSQLLVRCIYNTTWELLVCIHIYVPKATSFLSGVIIAAASGKISDWGSLIGVPGVGRAGCGTGSGVSIIGWRAETNVNDDDLCALILLPRPANRRAIFDSQLYSKGVSDWVTE